MVLAAPLRSLRENPRQRPKQAPKRVPKQPPRLLRNAGRLAEMLDSTSSRTGAVDDALSGPSVCDFQIYLQLHVQHMQS